MIAQTLNRITAWLGLSRTRVAEGLATRRFDGAAGGRRGQGFPTFNDINAEIGAAGWMLRRRSGYAARNNGWVVNGVNAWVTGLIGAGIRPRSAHSDEAVREQLHSALNAWTIEADAELRSRLESIRLKAGHLMGLGDVTDTTVPKLTMVSPPTAGGDISTRTFIPHRCHEAIGVFGAVSVATAALLPGTPAASVTGAGAGSGGTLVCEHPSGSFTTTIDVDTSGEVPAVRRAGIIRTARKLMDGIVFPRSH